MPDRFLYCVPRFDDATQYSYESSLRLAEELGGDQKRILEEEATRGNFETEIPNYNVFIFYDHGEQDRLVAQGGRSNILDLSNVDLVADKTVYTLACLSLKKLGVEVWKRDGDYWGNDEIVGFVPDDKELFYAVWNHGAILKWKHGLPWKECLDLTKKKCDENMGKTDNPWSKMWLNSHRESLGCYNGEEPPPSDCRLRRLAIRLFGPKLGWKIPNPF